MIGKGLMLSAAVALGAGLSGWAASVDFAQVDGKVRPELHSSGFGPTICSQTEQDLADIRAMGFKMARTHDWALVNPNQRVCDYFHIFPLMHLDAADPANYVFGPTDYLLKRTREEAGLGVFFRLGTSIEHSGKKIHFNAAIPSDFDKVAETFAATVRHYNRGWANGHKWGIKYWEIWNEPDGIENMWCDAVDVGTLDETQRRALCDKCCDSFVRFYVTVLKRLKSEFGDEIKVGGPALCWFYEYYFRRLLTACREAGVAPDFISWHAYVNDPEAMVRDAEKARQLLDGFGFTACEPIVNEWHYFGHGDYTWDDMQRCSDPAVKARIWSGPRSHNGIHSTCFTLATLARLQRSKLAQAYWYGCAHSGNWGFKDFEQAKYKVFYGLKLFGELMREYTELCASEADGPLTLLALKDASGRRKALLVVDYGGKDRTLEIAVKGVPADASVSCEVLDHTHDLVPSAVAFENGILRLEKSDGNSAAFLVVFTEGKGSQQK